MTAHTTVRKGKRVLVILQNGERFVAKFKLKTDNDREIQFYDHDPVATRDLRAMTIYKAVTRESHL